MMKRVAKLGRVCESLANMPLRYQSCRMIYTIRTTPQEKCGAAIGCADKAIETALGCILEHELAPNEAARVFKPTRLGGIGLQKLSAIADAAYLASSSAARTRIAGVWLKRRAASPHRSLSSHRAGTEE